MFDIGFSELMLIGVVALVVLGPERLPKVARTAGALLGRLNRYASQVKQDIDREIQLEELRKVQKDMQESAQKYELMAGQRVQEVETSIQQEVAQVDQALQEMRPAEASPVPSADAHPAATSDHPEAVGAELPVPPPAPEVEVTATKPVAVADHGHVG